MKLPLWSVAALLGLSAASAQPPVPDGSVRFLAFGDWGRDGKAFQLPVAEQMGRAAAADRCQFIVALGDNFYNDGVPSVHARQWVTSFEEIYTAPSLQVPWYVALGNHDYHTNPQAEIDYTLFSPRWKLPARYYTVTRQIDETHSVEFFIIDSSPYLLSYRRNPEYRQVLSQNTAAQTAWLDRELARSTAEWKIVCAHHPVYTCGSSHSDTAELIEHVEPLLEKHGVQVFLNGHVHDMEYLKVGRIHYFCSGAGSLTQSSNVPDARTRFALAHTGGFLDVKITAADFSARFIDYTGKEVYRTDFSPAAEGQ